MFQLLPPHWMEGLPCVPFTQVAVQRDRKGVLSVQLLGQVALGPNRLTGGKPVHTAAAGSGCAQQGEGWGE